MKKLLLLLATVMLTSLAGMAASYTKVSDPTTLKAGDKIILIGDYAQSGASNPYWLVTMNLTDVSKTNIPGQVLAQSATSIHVGDSYVFPTDKVPTDITLVNSENPDYPWLLQVTVNGTDYYLCCNSNASKSQMTFKKVSEKTDACMAKFDGTFQFNTTVTRKSLEFNISNGKTGATTFNCYNVGGQKTPVIFRADGQQPVKLGELTGVYGSESTSIDPETPVTVEEGTKFIFKADNATKMSIACGEDILSTEEGSELEWISDVRANSEMTVTASLNGEEKTLKFTLTSTEKSKVLGDIVVTYGDGINVENGTLEGLSVQTGTTFYISATNATHISAERWSDETVVVDVDSDNTSWTFNEVQEMEGLTITATNGVDTKTFEFLLEITEAPKPELGNLVVTYGDGIQVNEDDEISVEVGTTFTFSAENATNIKVESFMESLVVVNENANSATWTPESAFEQDGFTVTATDGTDSKTLTFLLTVTEPVVPEDEIWTLVTSSDNFVVGGKYIIANNDGTQAMSNENNANFRLITSVNVEENIIKNPSESVLRLTVEKDGDDYLWKTINYLSTAGNIASPQVYLNVGSGNSNNLNATNPNEGNEDRRNTSVAFDEDNVLITFVNALFKTGPDKRRIFFNNDRFATYAETNTNMGKVKLYKLVEPQPEVPTFDLMEKVATKVSVTSTKGELHVWTVEYDKDGNAVKENGEDVAASVMAKAPTADDKTWTNWVADEGKEYVIDVPTTAGNYMTIRAKSVLNGIHSEELVKNVDASGNVISGVEGVVADDANAPVEYFNLQGVRVAADQPGIYIRRQGSKVEKVSIAR